MGTHRSEKLEGQQRLEDELEWLLKRLNVHYDLSIVWAPDDQTPVSGELTKGVIYIYERDAKKALATLHHEVVDYYVMKEIVDPLVSIINVQKNLIDTLIYERKENFVDGLLRLLYENDAIARVSPLKGAT